MERRDEVRASDADRQSTADRLKVAVDEGRLSLSEYDERLRQAYAARTYGELDRVLADLPPDPGQAVALSKPAPPVPPPLSGAPATGRPATGDADPAASGRRWGGQPGWLVALWGAWLTAVLVNVAIWGAIVLTTGEPVYFWPIWVAGPWGAVLLVRTLLGLAGRGGR